MIVKSFKDVFKKIEKSVNTSTNQALNKAATSAKAFYAKEVSKELGVSSAKVKARAKVFKPTELRPNLTLSIGVQKKFAAQDFSVSKQKVMTDKGPRWNASYKLKGGDKRPLPGAFLTVAHNSITSKKLVLERVGDSRYPTRTVMVDDFIPTVERHAASIQQHMVEMFMRNLESQLKYNLSKK